LAASALQIARSCIFMRPRAEKLSAWASKLHGEKLKLEYSSQRSSIGFAWVSLCGVAPCHNIESIPFPSQVSNSRFPQNHFLRQ
jgi:hypothetical protein